MFVYCSTKDSPKTLGELICRANSIGKIKNSWVIKDEFDSCVIEATSNGHCVAIVYYVADSVVGIEIDNNCGSKVVEPLIEKYSFENVKWLTD